MGRVNETRIVGKRIQKRIDEKMIWKDVSGIVGIRIPERRIVVRRIAERRIVVRRIAEKRIVGRRKAKEWIE